MWLRRNDTLVVGLSGARAEWRVGGGSRHSAPLSTKGDRFEDLSGLIQAQPALKRFAALHVVCGSSLARHWLLTAPRGLRCLAELQAMVQSRAEQMFGTDPGWIVAADWDATRPFLCAALPRDVWLWATSLARSRGATLRLTTSLALALSRNATALPADGWTIVHEPEALHLLYNRSGRPTYVRTAIVAHGLGAGALETETSAELTRASALAGGLPAEHVARLSISSDSNHSQAGAAMELAARSGTGNMK